MNLLFYWVPFALAFRLLSFVIIVSVKVALILVKIVFIPNYNQIAIH